MTRTTNARLAGVTFLFYLAAGIASLLLAGWPHAPRLLATATSFSALILGVTLYSLTRDEDPDLALLGLVFRIVEGVPGEGGIYVAAGSAIFSWLLLRGRMIPAALAWFGCIASVLLGAVVLLQRGGVIGGAGSWSSSLTWFLWLPMLVFQVTLAGWLLTKGISEPRRPPIVRNEG